MCCNMHGTYRRHQCLLGRANLSSLALANSISPPYLGSAHKLSIGTFDKCYVTFLVSCIFTCRIAITATGAARLQATLSCKAGQCDKRLPQYLLAKKRFEAVNTHSKAIFKITIAWMVDRLKTDDAIIVITAQRICHRLELIGKLSFAHFTDF